MSEKPTYEELEQRIRELESSAVDHENATTISIEHEQMLQHCFENANIYMAFGCQGKNLSNRSEVYSK